MNIVLTGLFIASGIQSRGIKGACKQINPPVQLENGQLVTMHVHVNLATAMQQLFSVRAI